MLQERWLLWKADLYNLELILPQGCHFWISRLVYGIYSPSNSPSIYLLILLAYMTTSTGSAPLLLPLSSSSLYTIYMLLQILRPLMRFYWTLMVLPLLCSLFYLLSQLFLLLLLLLLPSTLLSAAPNSLWY